MEEKQLSDSPQSQEPNIYPQQPLKPTNSVIGSFPEIAQNSALTTHQEVHPRIPNKRKIFLIILAIIILLAALAIVSKMSSSNDTQGNKLASSSGSSQNVSSNTKTNVLADFSTYSDQELGMKFLYPSKWGEPIKKTRNNTDRFVQSNGYTEYDITFPNVPLFILPVINNKNNYLVQNGGCFQQVGFLELAKSQNPNSLKPGDWKQSETGASNHYTNYTKVLVGDSKSIVVMNFSISTIVNEQGYCNGLSVYGSQKTDNNSKNLGQVQFVWAKTATTFGKDQPKLDLKDLEDFKQHQTKYISDEDLTDLQATIKSIQTY